MERCSGVTAAFASSCLIFVIERHVALGASSGAGAAPALEGRG
ncbi:hypothetical protein WMF11_21535 [Sorangium sp. So ce295]